MKIKKINEIIPAIREHVVMSDFTTWRVGGVADYFIETKNVQDLSRVVKLAIENKIPYFVLGNGSNILFSDYGFPGLVIKNSTENMAVLKEKSQIIADSGVMLSRLITEAISNDLAGLEFLYGVPGTVGGALHGNAGAFGSSIGDYVKNVTILMIDEEDQLPKIVQKDREWMIYEYRSSKLKKIKSKFKPVILSARFQLSQNQKEEITKKLNNYKTQRETNQPLGFTAGSVFRNPIPSELKNITGTGTRGMPDLPKERCAGYLLDQVGVKKMSVGAAEVSGKHANFIVNKGDAKAADIRTLIEEMREKVRQKYAIILEEEIEYIGQW